MQTTSKQKMCLQHHHDYHTNLSKISTQKLRGKSSHTDGVGNVVLTYDEMGELIQ